MARLSIVNGREYAESITLKEGEFYEMDKYTSKFLDSDAIRNRHKREYASFQKNYPDGKRGSIRLVIPDGTAPNGFVERFVMYKKHIIAFQEIIKMERFMRSYAKTEQRGVYRADGECKNYTTGISNTTLKRDLNGMIYRNFNASLNSYIKNLKACDKRLNGVTGGGEKYFGMIRTVIFRYEEYIKKHPELGLLSVNEIYDEHMGIFEHASLKRTSKPVTIVKQEEPEYIQDDLFKYIYDESYNQRHDEYLSQDELEAMNPEYHYSFFETPEFDRYYGDLLHGTSVILTGDTVPYRGEQFYDKLYNICARCFDESSISCPPLGLNGRLMADFDSAKLLFMVMSERNKNLEYQLARASQNGTEIIVLSDDSVLVEYFHQKYPKAKVLYDIEEEKEKNTARIVSSFVKLYNDEYQRVYKR